MEQDALWNYLQTEAAESFGGAGPRLAWLARQLKRGATVLNIGVGDAAFERIALQSGLVVCSLDPSAQSIERLKGNFGRAVEARVGRAEAIPWPDSSLDAVVMSEVLEHLEDSVLTKTLEEIRRVLKRGGVFLGTVPANENLKRSSTICPCCNNVFHRWGHVRSFSAESLRATLMRSFSNVHVEDRFFTPWSDLSPKGLLSAMTKAPARSRAAPSRRARQWVKENWRPLLSSVPRLAARQVGVEFPSNLAFAAR